MKQNGNNIRPGDYYIGLDVGTNSVGWAVTDKEYNVLKFKGNAMWGVRLFDEASDASGRRSNRANRRRLNRRKQRLLLLEMLFSNEVAKVDPGFFARMSESSLWLEDKHGDSQFSLFNDVRFNDKDYHKKYPTIYHLRQELINSNEPHDVRLVYLALHHIIKSRGHFLYETDADDSSVMTIEMAMDTLINFLSDTYDIHLEFENISEFISCLQNFDLSITAKKKALKQIVISKNDIEAPVNVIAITELLAGATVKLSALYNDDSLKNAEVKSVCLKQSLDDNFDQLSSALGDRVDLLLNLKTVYDTARLTQILGGHQHLSEAKVELYEKNYRDLRLLKKYVRAKLPKQYKSIFSEKKDKLNNYAAYSRHKTGGAYECTQEDFCKYLKAILPQPDQTDGEMCRIYQEIKDGQFLPRLKGTDNGIIPYQLHRRELIKILDNAQAYLPFLSSTDADGITIREKIIKTFEFRVPYYVGPLNKAAGTYWAVRFAGKENDKVYPWNFENVIDTEASASEFIGNLIGKCTYTGERVLPKDSLLYSEYMLLNEINLLRVNGNPLPLDIKQRLINDLFYADRKTVTKKAIHKYLRTIGQIEAADVISGVDDTIKAKLKSYHDFKSVLDRTGDIGMVEEIIRAVLVFGNDKKMLRRWINKNTSDLSEEEIKRICRLKYSDWGRLSETFLDGITSEINGKEYTVIDCLRSGNENLMQLLSNKYQFAAKAEAHRNELFGNNMTLDDQLDELYISPAVRRSIRQTLRIVDEIVDIQKSAPAKIFIEMARDSSNAMKGKRTESRKNKLIELYKSCKLESNELFTRLENEDENNLRSDKLYLYYTQLGRCMYSGEPIDFESLISGDRYDIDHIFPQSKVKDDSIDNRVLVKAALNREKTNIYPIKAECRSNMADTWYMLKKKGFISEKKYERLIRSSPLTEKELSDFVARQLTETQQSTKALAVLLKSAYKDKTRIVYSKAGNVSDFRHDFGFTKCREINDLHHAKDAYLNIVVGNVYNTRFTDRFFSNIVNEEYSLRRVFDFNTKGAWEKGETIKTVSRWMAKNNVVVTRMPYEGKGQLFDLNITPAGKGQLEKKKGLDISKYGGYNKLAGAYFCVVEHTEKKKRIRAIYPVYIYKKHDYERDPIAYCKNDLGLSEPVIIAKKIRMDSLVEFDGKRLYICGRTGNRLICEHAYQLVADNEHEKYIKAASKYCERCALQKRELSVSAHDGLSADKNVDLYDWLIGKSKQPVYDIFLKNMRKYMEDNRDKFISMGILTQCKLLMEVLKAFSSNALCPNLDELCGKDGVAKILVSSAISGQKTAKLINQSATGLYEIEIDLLR